MKLGYMKEIFAVVWEDFIPLSLNCPSKDEAIAKAKEIKLKGGEKVRNVRAVHLPAMSDKLIVLWGPPFKRIQAKPTRKGLTSEVTGNEVTAEWSGLSWDPESDGFS